jgi:hypothetical protein
VNRLIGAEGVLEAVQGAKATADVCAIVARYGACMMIILGMIHWSFLGLHILQGAKATADVCAIVVRYGGGESGYDDHS